MPRTPSLALRLILLFAVAAAVIFPCFGWLISRSMEKQFEAEDIAELRMIGRAVELGLSNIHTAEDLASLENRFKDILVGHHRASMYLLGEDNRLIYASPGPDLASLLQASGGNSDRHSVHLWKDARHSYRVMIRHTSAEGVPMRQSYTIAIAVQIDQHLGFFENFRRTLWLAITGSIVVMILLGWLAIRQGHAPLRDMVDQIRRTSASRLNTRLSAESVPSELKDLAVSFNEMLQRMDQAFHRLADFNADIAHELRTLITNLMTQIQVLLSRVRTVDNTVKFSI